MDIKVSYIQYNFHILILQKKKKKKNSLRTLDALLFAPKFEKTKPKTFVYKAEKNRRIRTKNMQCHSPSDDTLFLLLISFLFPLFFSLSLFLFSFFSFSFSFFYSYFLSFKLPLFPCSFFSFLAFCLFYPILS